MSVRHKRAKDAPAKDARLHKALSHPLRHRILEQLNERVASPSDLAKQLDEPLGNVSYHVKILLDHQAIELVKTEPVRGALEHFYRATARPFFDSPEWAKLPLSVRDEVLASTLKKLFDHVVEAGKSGGLDDPDIHVSWTNFDLDDVGYQEMAELLGETLERAMAIQAETAERQAGLDEEERQTRRTELSILHYPRPRAGE